MGFITAVSDSGRRFLNTASQTGGVFILLFRVIHRMMTIDILEFKRCLLKMGYRSVPVIIATALIVGIILVIQAFVFVDRYGLRSQLGWGAGFVTIRELGPVLFALMFSGRVGAYTAAELGTMNVTDQVNALRCLALDPISYLVVPRFAAMIISLIVLTIIGNTAALLSASIVGDLLMEVDQHTFWTSFVAMLTPWDYLTSIAKAGFFGAIIAVTCCYCGLNARGGAPGVGRAVNASVVTSASAVFIVDFFSTFVLG